MHATTLFLWGAALMMSYIAPSQQHSFSSSTIIHLSPDVEQDMWLRSAPITFGKEKGRPWSLVQQILMQPWPQLIERLRTFVLFYHSFELSSNTLGASAKGDTKLACAIAICDQGSIMLEKISNSNMDVPIKEMLYTLKRACRMSMAYTHRLPSGPLTRVFYEPTPAEAETLKQFLGINYDIPPKAPESDKK